MVLLAVILVAVYSEITQLAFVYETTDLRMANTIGLPGKTVNWRTIQFHDQRPKM